MSVSLAAPRGTIDLKEYLPGDFVHIIVDAPVDTAQISAIMPDGSAIDLTQQRATHVWRGIWQVPVNFGKGTYAAKLRAVDLSGDIFEGASDQFDVGELAMISLVGKAKAPLHEKISLEAVAPGGVGAADILAQLRKLVAQPVVGPPPTLAAEEKQKLVDKNLTAGRSSLALGELNEAAAYFRIVLYLSPNNKDAGSYLLDTQTKIAQAGAESRQRLLIVSGLVFAFLVLIILVIQFLVRPYWGREVHLAAPSAPAPTAPPESKKPLMEILGWTANPFSAAAMKDVILGDKPLELKSLRGFIKTRIEAVNGDGLEPFTDSAIENIYRFSKGKPKQAIEICAWALDKAVKRNLDRVTAEVVDEYAGIAFKKILIADDEEFIRTTLEAILKKGGGYEVDFATDGEEVIRKVKENAYGAVLLDIVMPKLDGYQVLKRVREISPELPVIFVSGKGDSKKVMDSLSQDRLTALIGKPFTPEEVLDVVAKSLKLK